MISILLSTETMGYDASILSIAQANGYDIPGLDSNAARSSATTRAGLAYYRGIPITSWPITDRRRLVVVNVLAGSPSHQQYEILYNGDTPNTAATKTAIDAVQAAPAGVSFDAWKTTSAIPPGQDGPNDDPDRDGSRNLLEFHAGTDPLDEAARPTAIFARTATGFSFTYRRAKDRIGISHTLQTGPLDSFASFTPTGEALTDIAPNIEEVTVTLPPAFGPFLRQAVTLTP